MVLKIEIPVQNFIETEEKLEFLQKENYQSIQVLHLQDEYFDDDIHEPINCETVDDTYTWTKEGLVSEQLGYTTYEHFCTEEFRIADDFFGTCNI